MIATPSQTRRGKQVRYAVVGLGWIAQVAILPAFANASRNSRLSALVSGDADKLRKLGRRYGVDHLYTYEEYEACLESGEIDAVFIALPNDMHHEYTVRAAEKGIHVLCEKPLAVTEEECVEMIDAAEAGGVKLMTAYRLHFEAANLSAIEIVTSGKLGEVRYFSSAFSMNVTDADNIRLDPERGGGVLYDLGIYCINAARYIFQDEPEEVIAMTASPREKQNNGVDTNTSAVLRFSGGRLAGFTCSFAADSHSSYVIGGTKGILRVEPAFDFRSDLKHALSINGKSREKTFPHRDQFAPEIIHFSQCILEGTDPEPGGAEGLADIHIIQAIYESAESGQAVRLDEHTLSAAGRHRPDASQEMTIEPPKPPRMIHAREP